MALLDELKAHGMCLCKTEGDSMQPMLTEGKSTVIIKTPTFPLKKYDIPVYRREDRWVMHRIVHVTKKGGYIICGDNRAHLERDITEKDIVGVLAGYYEGDTFVDVYTDKAYLAYAKRVCRTYPIRFCTHAFKKMCQLFRRKNKKKNSKT